MILTTYDPITAEKAYTVSFFPKIPYAGPQKALILSGNGGERRLVITENTRVKTSDLKRGKFSRMAEVDIQPHTVAFKEKYLSVDRVSKFEIEIRATAQVREPEQVYEQGIHDVAQALLEEMEGHLQELAAAYELEESGRLREAVKSELGDYYQLNSGIEVRGIRVSVRMEQQYEKLRAKTQYEKAKAVEAKKLQNVYTDSSTAILAELAEENITAEEAVRRMKKGLSEDFDERIRQVRAVAALAEELQNQDFLKGSGVAEQMGKAVQELISDSMGRKKISLEEKNPKLEAKENPYRPFDEEE